MAISAKYLDANHAHAEIEYEDGRSTSGNALAIEKMATDLGVTIAGYAPPAPTWAGIRGERDALLKSTDWWAVSDRAMSAEETAYRQALRDVPQNFASPADVVWPTKPV